MRNNKKIAGILALVCILSLSGVMSTFAATTPSLGVAASYGVLSSTFTNTVPGTTINGDVGYTTGPAVVPTVNGTTYVVNGTYNQAGTDQGTTLASLNSQACTFTFAAGAIDLATDATHGTVGVYTPGVYCISGAASIGTAGITLNGAGTYIFRINGALTTVVNSRVTLLGASACDVFWTPTQAMTLAADTTFAGTVIDAAGITTGANTLWTGSALAFGGTVTTNTTNITIPTCIVAPPTPVVVAPVVVNSTGSITPPTPVVTSGSTSNTGNTTIIPPTPIVNNTGTITPVSIIKTGITITSTTTSIPTKIVPIVVYEPAPVMNSIETPITTPRLPDTGITPEGENVSWSIGILAGILLLTSVGFIMIQRKRNI